MPWCRYPVVKEVVPSRVVTASLEIVELVWSPQFGLRYVVIMEHRIW